MKRSCLVPLGVLAALVLSPVVLTAPAQAQVNCTGVAAWSGNSVAYAIGNLVTYSGTEYKCIQAHTSEAGWDPPAVPALWSVVGACATTTGTTTGSCSAVPSAPATPTASGTTSTSTNLSWTAVTPPANCTISSYEVYKNGTALASVTSGTSYSATGLTASTTYKFTVAAVDSFGTGAQSTAVSVVTSAACTTKPGTPGTPTASNTTSSGTSLSWSAVTPPTGCTISGYEVYENGTALASSTSTSYSVTGLTASTTYKFTVAAVDSDGTGTQSAAVSVVTSAACTTKPGTPATPTASGTTSTSTSLSWTAVTAPTGCTISGYEVYKNGTALASSTSTSYSVTGLTASTTYQFTVAAIDGAGTGTASAAVTVVTSAAPTCSATPSAPATPTASGTTTTGTSLSWSAVTPPANCTISSYEVYENGTALASTSSTSYSVTGLTASTTYTFTVAAVDSDGTGAQSASVQVVTSSGGAQGTCDTPWNATTNYVGGQLVSFDGVNYQADYDNTDASPATNSGGAGSGEQWIPVGFCTVCSAVAPAPTGLSASGTTASTTNLTWTAPTAPSGCSLTGYTIYENGTAIAYDVPTTSYTVNCLTPSTAYTFAVAVTDGAGPATWGVSAKSSTTGVTTSSGTANNCTPGNFGKPAMIGYWESYSSATLASVANGYDVIAMAFALPGGTDGSTVAMDTTDESAANIAADVATLHGQGKKVIVSIGGENATSVELANSTDISNFVNSVESIINQYGLDGVDLDLENETLALNAGDNDYTKPTTPSTVNLITAMNQLAAHYGSNFIYTMAPQTADIDGVGHYGTSSGLGWADFLPLIYNTRNIITYVMTQNYNSGQDYGLDGNIYTEATPDFNVAVTELLLHGMTLASPSVNPEFPSLNAKQVVMGVPATSGAAGGGYQSASSVLSAVSYLMEGTADGGSYKLAGGPYPTFGGVMTWDCDYDTSAGDPMESVLAPYLHAH